MKRPIESNEHLNSLFWAGRYQEVLNLSFDLPVPQIDLKRFASIIGSLVFIGRLEDATIIFEKYQNSIDAEELAAARFTLGLGHCRVGEYHLARKYFVENLLFARQKKVAVCRFYAFQGLAFFRYFSGRFTLAARHADKAYKFAVYSESLYGRVLAGDIKGHGLIQTGEIQKGLLLLKKTGELARKLGNGSIIKSIETSIVCYRARYIVGAENHIKEFESLLENKDLENFYSKNDLIMDLGRLFYLTGQLSKARELITEAMKTAISTGNRRHQIWCLIRLAEFDFCEGKADGALELLRDAEKLAHAKVDIVLMTMVAGLKTKILKENPESSTILKRLSHLSGFSVSKNIIARNQGRFTCLKEDEVGSLMDSFKQEGFSKFSLLSEKGYFGLALSALPASCRGNAFILDAIQKKCYLFVHGNIQVTKRRLTNLEIRFIGLVSRGWVTKELIIEKVWGHTYRPLDHDPLIYRLVSRLKQGFTAAILDSDSDGSYRMKPNFFYLEISSKKNEEQVQNHIQLSHLIEDGLSLRQSQILALVSQSQVVTAGAVADSLRVSMATAQRDLSGLVLNQNLIRLGKGRATQYILKSQNQKGIS